MSIGMHKALVQRYIDEVWNHRRLAMPFFAPHYKRYVAATAVPLTANEQQERIGRFQRAFPDLHMAIDDLLEDGDRVVFRATMRGTHQEPFGNIAPTGRQIAVMVLDVVRIEHGLFVEHWGGPDTYDLLQQLGSAPVVRATEHETT